MTDQHWLKREPTWAGVGEYCIKLGSESRRDCSVEVCSHSLGLVEKGRGSPTGSRGLGTLILRERVYPEGWERRKLAEDKVGRSPGEQQQGLDDADLSC